MYLNASYVHKEKNIYNIHLLEIEPSANAVYLPACLGQVMKVTTI
jgi:hypothetical protein